MQAQRAPGAGSPAHQKAVSPWHEIRPFERQVIELLETKHMRWAGGGMSRPQPDAELNP
jgi:hypothetical protein